MVSQLRRCQAAVDGIFFFLTFQTSNKNGWNQSNCHFSLSCDPRHSLT